MKIFFSFLATVLVLASCSLEQNYVFNEDFSGSYSLVFDMNEIVAFSSEDPDSTEDAFADLNVDSLKLAYEQMEGISNVKISGKDNVLHMSYNFASIDALNKSLETENNATAAFGGNATDDRFSYQNGIFKYNFPISGDAESLDSLAQMMSIVEYNIHMQFAKPIAKTSNGEMGADGKSLRFEGNLGEVANKEKSLDLEVSFK